eukprot:61952-Rhodomonas_salina.3
MQGMLLPVPGLGTSLRGPRSSLTRTTRTERVAFDPWLSAGSCASAAFMQETVAITSLGTPCPFVPDTGFRHGVPRFCGPVLSRSGHRCARRRGIGRAAPEFALKSNARNHLFCPSCTGPERNFLWLHLRSGSQLVT